VNRWLTVNPISVANPDVSAGDRLCPPQYRHTGCGGWISAEQDSQRRMRSFPSAPDVQKNSFSRVSSGRGRPGDSGKALLQLKISLPNARIILSLSGSGKATDGNPRPGDGGYKQSGIGKEMGRAGLEELLESKTLATVIR